MGGSRGGGGSTIVLKILKSPFFEKRAMKVGVVRSLLTEKSPVLRAVDLSELIPGKYASWSCN